MTRGAGGRWGGIHAISLLCGPPAHTSTGSARAALPGDGFPCRGTGMTGEGGCGWGMNNVLGVRAIDQSPLQRGMDSRLGALSAYLRSNDWVTGHDAWRRQVSGQVLDPSRSLGMTQREVGPSAGTARAAPPGYEFPIGVGDDGGGRVWVGDE